MYSQAYSPSAPIAPVDPYRMNSNPSMDSEERLRKFEYLVNRYEINREFATRLRALDGYEIVFIVDGKSNKRVFSSIERTIFSSLVLVLKIHFLFYSNLLRLDPN